LRLTFRTAGVDRRLTDVHGHVIDDILAKRRNSRTRIIGDAAR